MEQLWFARFLKEDGDDLLVQLRPFHIGSQKAVTVLVQSNAYKWLRASEEERQVVVVDQKLYPCTKVEGINYYVNSPALQTGPAVLRDDKLSDERIAS